MPKLGAQARFSSRGDRNAHVAMDDPLENKGFALWIACQGKVKTSKSPKVKGPADRGVGTVDGYEIEVNLKRKVFELWPQLNQTDRASQDAFISEIYSYLRASGNAICVLQPGLGQHGIPRWWLREKWNDVKAVGIYRQTQLTAREQRLTPQEAGEDREPSPVSVRQREEAAAAAEAAAESADTLALKKDRRAAAILSLLAAAKEPMYQREIAEELQLTALTTGNLLRELEADGKVFRRQESREERPEDASGRYRYLYWDKKKVPTRTTPFSIGNQTMERVWALKPGESMGTQWMSPGNRQQVAQMVKEGLLEYINEGTPDERIRLAPATSSIETATEEAAEIPSAPQPPEPAPVTPQALTGVVQPTVISPNTLAHQLERLIELNVETRLGEVARTRDEDQRTIEALREEVAREFERAEAAERERDELKERLKVIRSQLSM